MESFWSLWIAGWLLGQSWEGPGQAGLRRREATFMGCKACLKLSYCSCSALRVIGTLLSVPERANLILHMSPGPAQ